jgi:hypothetical protein
MIQKPVIFNGAIMFHRERLPESGQTKGIYQQCAYNVVGGNYFKRMRRLSIVFIISLFSHVGLCQDGRLTVRIKLSLTDLYVVNLEVVRKIDDGLCDCSVGDGSKNNKCALYEIVIKGIKYQADSTVFSPEDLLRTTKLLVSKELRNEIKTGDFVTAILTNTSSKEYLRFKSKLVAVASKEFLFLRGDRLTSLIECRDKQLTFRKK